MLRTSEFLDALRRWQLLTPEQFPELASLPQAEPRALAAELIKKGWLTPYQVNRLFQGRGLELVLGPYVVLERLGEGGMGAVYKARHAKLGRVVALKVIRPERLQSADAVRRFHREVRAAAQLTHPNVVRAMDADTVSGSHFLVLEYVDGIDLARLVKQQGPLPVKQACEYIRQAALGLQHAFERGLVHRDIKPHNLLLTRDGTTVKLLDMGLARLAQSGEQDTEVLGTMTQDGAMMGTADYIAPEQAESAHQADIRADLYSLGCTFYFLLTGEVPFPGASLMQKLLRHKEQEPAPLQQLRPDVPASVAAVVQRLMRKRPEERYQRPADLVQALAALGRPAPAEVMPAPVAAPVASQATEATLNTGSTDNGDLSLPGAVLIDRDSASSIIRRRPRGEHGGGLAVLRRHWRIALGVGGGVALLGVVLVFTLRPRPAAETKRESETKKVPTRRPAPDLTLAGPGDDAWYRSVAALPAEEQVGVVLRRLRELNPGFDGKAEHKIEHGAVTELRLGTELVSDISPVRALTRLARLECRGGRADGVLSDLAPLQELRLTYLDCGANPVADLSPLKAMPIFTLRCDHTRVADLTPLQQLPLLHLDCSHTAIQTLAPLQGIPLRTLDCQDTLVNDLTPIAAMLLTSLACGRTAITDLSPLKGMPLAELSWSYPRRQDVPILQSLPLKRLTCDFSPWRDEESLRLLRALEQINGQPAAVFWNQVKEERANFDRWAAGVAKLSAEKQAAEVGAELKRRNPEFDGKLEPRIEGDVVTGVTFVGDDVGDLSPLRALAGLKKLVCAGSGREKRALNNLWPLQGLSLTEFDCRATAVPDLAPLRGMPLAMLDFSACRVTDLAPLRGMPLIDLNCNGNVALADLRPLAGSRLHRLAISSTAVVDVTPLRDVPLAALEMQGSRVSDWSPLKGVPLEKFWCDFNPWRDTPLVRSFRFLSLINGVPAAQFWKTQDDFDAWCQLVPTFPPDEQMRRLTEKLKERNPGFDGKFKSTVEGGAITGVELPAEFVADLAPLRALPKLRRLSCSAADPGQARLTDLWPLHGLSLAELRIENTPIVDLTPLKGMRLSVLNLAGCPIENLAPLKEMPLKELICTGTRVADLAPLRKAPLTLLHARKTPVLNLAPLEALPLEDLAIDFSPWRDARVLRSLKALARLNGEPAAAYWARRDQDQKDLDAWVAKVRELSAEQQAKAVAAELKRRNPEFDDRTFAPTIELGTVVGLQFSSTAVTDLGPVRGLPGLKRLDCRSHSGVGQLADLGALRGLPLEALNCEITLVSDLEPLRGMPLTELRCSSTRVSDLGPVQGMPLKVLAFSSTAIADLTPLRGLPLASLTMDQTRVTDLAPLKDLPLKELTCSNCQVTDLAPLRGMPLVALNIGVIPVADLSPLQGMRLTYLYCDRTLVSDLSPLRGMPLTYLSCNRTRVRDLTPLRGMPLTQLSIAECPVDDLTPLRGAPLQLLYCWLTYITDLSPLHGMPLTTLNPTRTRIADLAQVRGFSLQNFACDYMAVEDLTPLQGMPLVNMSCEASRVMNLAPLKNAPLQVLRCDFHPERDSAVLRAIPTLQNINGLPPAQVLEKAGRP